VKNKLYSEHAFRMMKANTKMVVAIVLCCFKMCTMWKDMLSATWKTIDK